MKKNANIYEKLHLAEVHGKRAVWSKQTHMVEPISDQLRDVRQLKTYIYKNSENKGKSTFETSIWYTANLVG